jgi:hypothetical protein
VAPLTGLPSASFAMPFTCWAFKLKDVTAAKIKINILINLVLSG